MGNFFYFESKNLKIFARVRIYSITRWNVYKEKNTKLNLIFINLQFSVTNWTIQHVKCQDIAPKPILQINSDKM